MALKEIGDDGSTHDCNAPTSQARVRRNMVADPGTRASSH
jgi:hypothetical protein